MSALLLSVSLQWQVVSLNNGSTADTLQVCLTALFSRIQDEVKLFMFPCVCVRSEACQHTQRDVFFSFRYINVIVGGTC